MVASASTMSCEAHPSRQCSLQLPGSSIIEIYTTYSCNRVVNSVILIKSCLEHCVMSLAHVGKLSWADMCWGPSESDRGATTTLPKSGRLLGSSPRNACIRSPHEDHHDHEQIITGFLWCGKTEANGGNCSVAWDDVCMLKWAGGLGIPILKWLSIAM